MLCLQLSSRTHTAPAFERGWVSGSWCFTHPQDATLRRASPKAQARPCWQRQGLAVPVLASASHTFCYFFPAILRIPLDVHACASFIAPRLQLLLSTSVTARRNRRLRRRCRRYHRRRLYHLSRGSGQPGPFYRFRRRRYIAIATPGVSLL